MKTSFLLVLLMVIILVPSVAMASTTIEERFNIGRLLDDIDDVSTVIIATIRSAVAIFTVILIISIGYSLWKGPSGQGLEIVKNRIYFVVAGLFIIFTAEPIVKFIMGTLNK